MVKVQTETCSSPVRSFFGVDASVAPQTLGNFHTTYRGNCATDGFLTRVNAKVAFYCMVTATVVEWLNDPDVAVTVTL
jgi:hypothetical protein